MLYQHVPVLLNEVLKYLHPVSGQKFIDGTLGGASYTIALARAVGEEGQVISLDLDSAALANASKKIEQMNLKNIKLVSSNFKNIIKVVASNFPAGTKFDGMVADLGLSSAQLDDTKRGFSFQSNRPLDMSFGDETAISTVEIVNTYSRERLSTLFKDSGVGVWGKILADRIVLARKKKRLTSTNDLLELITQVAPRRYQSDRHPATLIFQALRLETNGERESLKEFLSASWKLLKNGGVLAIVSFHSGEDGVVKDFFRNNSKRWQILTPHPIIAGQAELNANPRARSAKLRVARLLN